MELTLTPEEQEILLDALEQHHQELLEEIAHTDRRDLRQALRRNEKVLDSLVSRLRTTAMQEVRG